MTGDRLFRRAAIGAALLSLAAVLVTGVLIAVPGLKTFVGLDPALPERYHVGDRVGVPGSLFESSARTVLIFGRGTCSACRQAEPVFTAMIENLRLQRDVRVVFVSVGESAEDSIAYANRLGVPAADVHSLQGEKIPVPYIPTVIVTDRSGTILLTREGIPTEDDSHTIVTTAAPGLLASE